MLFKQPLVSVIIPVYNAETSLRGTLDSLHAQTYANIEVIFINDCSTDRSELLLKDFKLRYEGEKFPRIELVTHGRNSGVAAARNTGLGKARGDYLYFVDADDRLVPEAIKNMVDVALTSGAEIVGCDWYLEFEKNARRMYQPAFTNPDEAIEWMLTGKMRWNLWLFLVKQSLYMDHGIRFIRDMNMGEDMLVVLRLFIHARKVQHLKAPLYYYGQQNASSLTKMYTDRHVLEVTGNLQALEAALVKSRFVDRAETLISQLKLTLKLPCLMSGDASQHERWRNWFPEVNHLAAESNHASLRIRMLQWAALNKQDWLIRWHYRLIIKLVYGIIYK